MTRQTTVFNLTPISEKKNYSRLNGNKGKQKTEMQHEKLKKKKKITSHSDTEDTK